MPGQWATSNRAARLPANWRTEIRPAVLARDGYQCQIQWDDGCEGTATEVDHIQRGDNHHPANLQSACHWCHARKSSAEGRAAQRRWSSKRKPERHPGLR